MDGSTRDIYNKFGPDNITFDPRKDELNLISGIATNYIFWAVMIYLMTVGKPFQVGRTWIVVMMIFFLIIEVFICLTETTLPAWFPEYMTEYEFILLVHSAFPCIIAGLCLLAKYLYVDIEKYTVDTLMYLITQQKVGTTIFIYTHSITLLTT